MCGIVAYLGDKPVYPILIKGLQRLEYRGYDSSGVALISDNKLHIYKKSGKVVDLDVYCQGKIPESNIGMGHTRWATHGAPNDLNAHPHVSHSKRLAIIHNGIIENYMLLKKKLEKKGYTFQTDTDTEVLLAWIEEIWNETGKPLVEALCLALTQVVGAYAIVLMSNDDPGRLIAARKSSPLVVGIGEGEYFFASDATPIIEYTNHVVYLKDEEIADISLKDGLKIRTIDNLNIEPYIQQIKWELQELEKGGYDHFMLKEIYEQPQSIADSLRGRIDKTNQLVTLGGIKELENKLLEANRIIILACGTSWHAALVGEYLIEDLARINVEVEYASEFRYRNPIIREGDVVIAISQSGETADTLAAVKLAKQKGATIFGICNVVGSSISRITDAGSYTHAGPEIGVASTKAFTAQLSVLSLLALRLGYRKGSIAESRYHTLINELRQIPDKVEIALKEDKTVEQIAKAFKDVRNFLYLGRGYNFPVALEGALKLKEISYIHAEGYPAAEMKHGPIALIDKEMPVVVLATNRSAHEKIISNIKEVSARCGKIIAIVSKGDQIISELADYVVEVPETEEPFSPIVSVIPLQLLSYHIAVLRGCNVDQPRNLAKSVTVE